MTFWRDKVVVVTGGSAGLGFVLSQAYATAGSQVVIASRNENQGQQAVENIGSPVSYTHLTLPTTPYV